VLFVLASLVFSNGELLLPDNHDDPQSHSSLVLSSEHVDTEAPESPTPHGGHTSILDHCSHGHLFAVDDNCAMAELSHIMPHIPRASSAALVSVVIPPNSRPPIA
jgi:hypothetical protein